MKHKLIIIDGQSTVGKSSISKRVFKQIDKQEQTYWLHEECEEHPIRHQEFDAGDIYTLEGMELNRKVMLQKWEDFKVEIEHSQKVCIIEGCFLHSIDRYLIESIWNKDQILNYFNDIMKILQNLNPLIVFVYRPNLKSSFEKAFKDRGDWWKNLILRIPESNGYFKTHPYTGDESIYACLTYEQEMMSNIFDALSCNKMKIDTSDEEWENYSSLITESAGFRYYKQESKTTDIEKYCGKYQIQDCKESWHICYDEEKKEVYTSLFWPYMPMKYMGNNQFELISFPVKLDFEYKENKMQFIVSGNYDWDFNGKTFIKQ